MSHKLPGPPIGPFSAHAAHVDGASTSATEDGSTANPYKTIQAAINAAPAATSADDAVQGWAIYVRPGYYDEALTVAGPGRFYIEARGVVILGTLAVPRNITYAPAPVIWPTPNALYLKGLRLELGGLVVTGGIGVAPYLELDGCTVGGALDGSAILTAATASLRILDSSVTGLTDYNGSVALERAVLTTLVCRTLVAQNSIAVDVTAEVSMVSDGNALSGNVATVAAGTLRGTAFGGTLTFTGAGTRMDNCSVTGLVTFAASGPQARGCLFSGGVTVVDLLSAFHDCVIAGVFTGGAGSYRVDGATNSVSAPILFGGATLDLVHQGGSELEVIDVATGAALYLGVDGVLEQSVVAPNDLGGNQVLVTNYANRLVDHSITPPPGMAVNPFFGVFSDLDPSGAGAGMYLSLQHNQTDGIIATGAGALELSGANQIINFGDGAETTPEYAFRCAVGGDLDVQLGRINNLPYFGTKVDGTAEQAVLYSGSGTGRQLIITNSINKSVDHAHAPATDPVLYIHSTRVPGAGGAGEFDWLSLTHNQTRAEIATGLGMLRLLPATNEVQVGDSTGNPIFKLNGIADGNNQLIWLEGGATSFEMRGVGATDQMLAGVGAGYGRMLCLTDSDNLSKDHGHGAPETNPILYIHSARDPEVAGINDWLSLTHNQTRSEITSGNGAIRLRPANSEISILAAGTEPSFQLGYGWGAFPLIELISSYTDEQSMLLVGNRTGGDSGGHGGNHLILASAYVGVVHQRTVDYGHAVQPNPTLFIHSATDPTAGVPDATQWLSLHHDQSHARIETGSGDVRIGGASGYVRFRRLGTTYDHTFGSWSNIDSYTMSPNSATGMVLRTDLGIDQLSLQVYTTSGKQFVITDGDTSGGLDAGHAPCTTPTLFIHSDKDVDDSDSEYSSHTHDGDDVVRSSGLGGHKFNIDAQPARGTMTLTGGDIVAAEDFDINVTTVTARAGGAVADEFNIVAGDEDATCDNIVAAVNDPLGSESGNVHCFRGAGDTVIFEWLVDGVAGNAIVLTTGMTNTTVDGGGTLGGTHLGVAASTPFHMQEDGQIVMTPPGNFINDAAAQAGGVPLNGIYRNGSVLMIRVV